MSQERVTLAFAAGVATITLDRPERLNALDVAMRDRLWELLLAVRDDPGTSAVVLRAAGPHFSVGADLREFGTAGSLFTARRVRFERPLWELLWTLPKPIVAALRGHVLGSGLELALMCDVRLAAPDAQLALPEARFGMLPAAGGTQTLTRAVGPSRALAMVLPCATLDAAAALRAGVVDVVTGDGTDVDARAHAMAAGWAALGTVRTRLAKQALRAAVDLPADAADAAQRRLARVLLALGDG